MEQFALFKRFSDKIQAVKFADDLRDQGIECELINDSLSVDLTFTGNASAWQGEIQLMVKQSDFERANKVLDKSADEILSEVNQDHYLFGFTNEELLEILSKSDEWSMLDYKLARQILTDRGQDINEHQLNTLKQERIKELSKPDKEQTTWIVIGYLSSILGGFLGMIIGWYLWKSKKTIPTGEKVFFFSYTDRAHGKRIFTIGLIVFPIALLMKIIHEINKFGGY